MVPSLGKEHPCRYAAGRLGARVKMLHNGGKQINITAAITETIVVTNNFANMKEYTFSENRLPKGAQGEEGWEPLL